MTEEEIAEQVERLRGGAVLDPKSIKAIVGGIARRFTELAGLWGDKRFFIEASVSIDSNWSLVFSKHSGEWEFLLLNERNSRLTRMSEGSLGQRIHAVEYLPALEERLVKLHAVDKNRLLSALDSVTRFAEGEDND